MKNLTNTIDHHAMELLHCGIDVGLTPFLMLYDGSNLMPMSLDVNRKIFKPRFTSPQHGKQNILYNISTEGQDTQKSFVLLQKDYYCIFTSFTDSMDEKFKGLQKHTKYIPLTRYEGGTVCYTKAHPLTTSILINAITWLKGTKQSSYGRGRDFSKLSINELLIEYTRYLGIFLPDFEKRNNSQCIATFIHNHDWSSNKKAQLLASKLSEKDTPGDLWKFILTNLARETRVTAHFMDGNHRVLSANMLISNTTFPGTPTSVIMGLEGNKNSMSIHALGMKAKLFYVIPDSIEPSLIESIRNKYSFLKNEENISGVKHGWREFLIGCMKYIKNHCFGNDFAPLWESSYYLNSLRDTSNPHNSIDALNTWTKSAANVILVALKKSPFNVAKMLGITELDWSIDPGILFIHGKEKKLSHDRLMTASFFLMCSLLSKDTHHYLMEMLCNSPSRNQCSVASNTETYVWLSSFCKCSSACTYHSKEVWMEFFFAKLDKKCEVSKIPPEVIHIHLLECAVFSGATFFCDMGELPQYAACGLSQRYHDLSRGRDLIVSISNEFIESMKGIESIPKAIRTRDMVRFLGAITVCVCGESHPDESLISLTNNEYVSFDMRTKRSLGKKPVLSLYSGSTVRCEIAGFFFDIYSKKDLEEDFLGMLENFLTNHPLEEHDVIKYCMQAFRRQFEGYPNTKCRDVIENFFRNLYKNYVNGVYGEPGLSLTTLSNAIVEVMDENIKQLLTTCSPEVCQCIATMKKFPPFRKFELRPTHKAPLKKAKDTHNKEKKNTGKNSSHKRKSSNQGLKNDTSKASPTKRNSPRKSINHNTR